MVRELVLWKSGVPIFQPSGGKGREQISAKAMSSSWTKNESSYNNIAKCHCYAIYLRKKILHRKNLIQSHS